MTRTAASSLLKLSVYRSSGEGDRIPVAELGRTASNYAALFERLTLERSGAKPAIRWVVDRVDSGSLHLLMDTVPLVDDLELAHQIRDEVAHDVVGGLRRVEDGEDVENVYSPEASEIVAACLALLHDDAVRHVIGFEDDEVTLTAEGAGRRDSERPGQWVSIGTVEGMVKTISLSDQPHFTVYRDVGGPGVRCYFEIASDFQRVKDALLRRVIVAGRIARRDDGIPSSIRRISGFKVFDETPLPTVDDLVGIDPGMTGGLPSEEWIEARRFRG